MMTIFKSNIVNETSSNQFFFKLHNFVCGFTCFRLQVAFKWPDNLVE